MLRDASHGHVIVPFWSVHQITIAILAAERFGLRPVLERFAVVADDSFGGEIMYQVGEALGLRMRRLHTSGNARRLQDLSTWIREPSPFFIAVDGGNDYGSVPTGIVRLAARLQSTLWPLAVRARPTMHCPGLVADIPLGRASVVLGVGSPLAVGPSVRVVDAAAQLKRSLDGAAESAGRTLTTVRLLPGGSSPVTDGPWRQVG